MTRYPIEFREKVAKERLEQGTSIPALQKEIWDSKSSANCKLD